MLRQLPPEWKDFLQDNAYIGTSTVLAQASTLLFSALFARRSSEEFGFFQYFLSIVGLLAVFSLPGLEQSLKIEVSRNAYPLGQFLKAKLRYGLLAAMAALVAAGVLHLTGRGEVALTVLLAAPLLPLYYSLPLYGAALEGKLQFDLLARLRIAKTATVYLTLLLPVLLRGSASLISLGFLLLNIGADSLILLYLRSRHAGRPLPPEQLSDALTYARHLTFARSLGIARQNVDRFVVGSFLPPSLLAIYSIAAGLSQRLRLLSTTTGRALFPRMASLPESKAKAVVRRQFPRWIIFTVGVCLVAVLLARPFILLVYGEEYTASVYLSYVLILIIGLGMLSMPLGTLVESQRRTDILYRANAVSSLLEIGLTLLLVPLSQLSGVLWSKAAARAYLLTALIYLFSRRKGRPTQ